jgi:environmental stress-induced protein Ves
MIIEHIKAADLTTSNWSGGTTTQLVIYPKDSDYKKQNFQFRISTATVEADESDFTKLSGVSRKLMILNGEIDIEHKNKYSKNLKKFDQDEFSGDWETKSFGKATDFNIMTTGNTSGELKAISISKSTIISLQKNTDCYALYIFLGKIELIANDKKLRLQSGDIVLLFLEKDELCIKLLPELDCEIILSSIKYNK